MTTVLIQNTFEPAAGFDNETAVSSFVLSTQGTFDDAARLVAFDAVADFYTEVATGNTRTIGSYLSVMLTRGVGGVQQKMYDLTGHADGSPYGSPIALNSFQLPAATNLLPLPHQVACAVTLRGRGAVDAPVEGPGDSRPRARLTGRMFVGPLNSDADSQSSGGHSRPHATFRSHLLVACEAMQDYLNSQGWIWCVWSRSNGLFRGVTSVEVDDSWDVLRSRKMAPTTRTKRVFDPVPSLALGA